jgi:mycothiol maleylpyruvate isomerase-like protein
MRAAELLVEAGESVLPLLRSPVLSDRWEQPSALTAWSNGGLAGHLSRSAFNLERALDQRGGDEGLVDAVAYYANSDPEKPDSPVGRRIRELGDQEAAAGQAVLADRFAASVARLRAQAVPLAPTVAVLMFGRHLSIDDCAAAGLLESRRPYRRPGGESGPADTSVQYSGHGPGHAYPVRHRPSQTW